jgi:hypothetical protein
MLLRYLDLPEVPDELIVEVYKSLEGIDRFPYKNNQYKSFGATQPLVEFTQRLFNFEHNTAVHIIKDHLIIHKDFFRTRAYNYIIDPGGDNVQTCFYDDNENLIESHCIEPYRWHEFDASINHNVINLTSPRIAITLFDKSEIPLEHQW